LVAGTSSEAARGDLVITPQAPIDKEGVGETSGQRLDRTFKGSLGFQKPVRQKKIGFLRSVRIARGPQFHPATHLPGGIWS